MNKFVTLTQIWSRQFDPLLGTLPEVECSGVAQMLLPDVDQIVTSSLSFTFLKLEWSSIAEVCTAQ